MKQPTRKEYAQMCKKIHEAKLNAMQTLLEQANGSFEKFAIGEEIKSEKDWVHHYHCMEHGIDEEESE